MRSEAQTRLLIAGLFVTAIASTPFIANGLSFAPTNTAYALSGLAISKFEALSVNGPSYSTVAVSLDESTGIASVSISNLAPGDEVSVQVIITLTNTGQFPLRVHEDVESNSNAVAYSDNFAKAIGHSSILAPAHSKERGSVTFTEQINVETPATVLQGQTFAKLTITFYGTRP